MLPKNLIDIPIATGLSQKYDSRVLQVGAQTTLDNCVIDKFGRVEKRPGATAHGRATYTGSALTQARRLGTYRDNIVVFDGSYLYTNDEQTDTRVQIDNVSEATVRRFGVAGSGRTFDSYDQALGGGYIAYAWVVATGSSFYPFTTIVNANTGDVIVPSYNMSSAVSVKSVRVIYTNGKFIYVYSQVGGNNIYGISYTPSTNTWSSPSTLVTDSSAGYTGRFDIMAHGTEFLMVYGIPSGPNIGGKNFTSTFGAGSYGDFTFPPPAGFGTNILGVGLHVTAGETLWVTYACHNTSSTDVTIRCQGFTTTNPITPSVADTSLWSFGATGALIQRLSVTRVSSTVCCVVGSQLNQGGALLWRQFNTSASALGASARQLINYALASKPFVQGSKTYVMAQYVTQDTITPHPHYALVDLITSNNSDSLTARPVAVIAPRLMTSTAMDSFVITPQVINTATDVWQTVGSIVKSSAVRAGFEGIVFDFRDKENHYQIAQLGECGYLSGGIVQEYDGVRVTEHGFLYPPDIQTGPTASQTGGSMTNGTYNYALCWAWVNGRGQIVRSTPVFSSAGAVIASPGNNGSVAITTNNYSLTCKQDYTNGFQPAVWLEVYRTQGSVSGAIYYKVFSDDVPTSVLNSPLTSTITYTDTAADSAINANIVLYTTGASGDSLPNQTPSGSKYALTHMNRLVTVADDLVTIYFSTPFDGGTYQPRFNDAPNSLTLPLAQGGIITGIASMDGQLFVFKRESIYVIAGAGPNDTGEQADWSIRQVHASIGCTDARSIVAWPGGICFQFEDSICLLNRGLAVDVFSDGVEDTIEAYPIVTSAVHLPLRDEVRFGLKATESATTGVEIWYNYHTQTWSTHSRYDSSGSVAGASSQGATVASDVYWMVTPNGYLYKENTDLTANSAYLDGNHWITMTCASAWLKAEGIAGFGRFRRALFLYEQSSAHDMTVSVGYDYRDGYTSNATYNTTTIATFTTPKEQPRLHIDKQKSQAVRFQFQDATPTSGVITTGAGARIISATVEVGTKHRTRPVYSGQGGP